MNIRRSHLHAALLSALVACGAAAVVARADDKDKTQPDFKDGALYGRVLDVTTGKPVPGATVAVTDKDGKVLAWSKTNDKGEYAIAVDTVKALHLHPSHGRGLLEEVAKAVGDTVTAPVRIAANVVKYPKEAVTGAAVSVATGNPLPLAAQTVLPAVVTDPKDTKKETQKEATENAIMTAMGERQAGRQDPKKLAPGEVMVAVSAPNYREIKGKAGAYWLDPAEVNGKPAGPKGWLETVKVASASAPPDKKCIIENEAFLLTDPHIEPSLVPPGGKVTVRAKLQTPAGEKRSLRIFAREEKKRSVVELKPDDKGVYSGEIAIDPQAAPGKTVITVCGLRTEPLEVKLDPKKGDALAEFARRLDDMDAGKPFDYDPRIMACENRLDFPVTILDPKKATPVEKKG